MTQAEIISIIVGATGCPKTVAESTYKSLVNVLVGRMKDNGRATLPGLGTLHVRTRAARPERPGRNPKTGEALVIPAKPEKKGVVLVAAKALKEAVNG